MDPQNQLSLSAYLASVESSNNVSPITCQTTVPVIPTGAVCNIISNLERRMSELASKMDDSPKKEDSLLDLDEPESPPVTIVPVFSSSFTLPFEHKESPPIFANTSLVNTIQGSIPSVMGLAPSVSGMAPGLRLNGVGERNRGIGEISNPSVSSTNFSVSSSSPVIRSVNVPVGNNINNTELTLMKQQLSLLTEAVGMLAELVKNSQKPKVVAPSKFQYELEHDLPRFFLQFEQFCSINYPGAHDQWCRLLEKYLEGSFLKLYTVVIKTVDNYWAVKTNLLKWFTNEERRKNENRLHDFMSAQRLSGESINMFALRLEHLAGKAYPGVNMRDHDALRTAFLLNLPKNVEHKLKEYIIQNEVTSGIRVPWERLVTLADCYDYDRRNHNVNNCNTEKNIGNSEKSSLTNNGIDKTEVIEIDTVNVKPSWSDIVRRNQNQPLSRNNFVNRKSSRDGDSDFQNVNSSKCEYCGKDGHVMRDCYKFLGICSYCKQRGHIRSDCRATKTPIQNINTKLDCPFCQGPHLGMNCQNNKQNPSSYLTTDTKTLTFTNSQKKTENNITFNKNSKGAVPKHKFIENCQLCGGSHNEGSCFGDNLN